MPRPLCTVICPTIGRPTLTRTLAAIRAQVGPAECEVLVVADTHAGTFTEALRPVPRLCRHSGARYVAHDGGLHAWGHPQRQRGQQLARGQWLLWTQDDNCWTVGAWAAIHAALTDAAPLPRVFQVQTWAAGVVPRDHRLELGNVDADGICCPNRPEQLATWGLVYAADFAYLRDTVALYHWQMQWHDTVIAAGRHWADVLGAA